MTPDVVVDIGNSRMKWGRVDARGLNHFESLGHDDTPAWDHLISEWWQFRLPVEWAAAGVNPDQLDRFVRWAEGRGDRVAVIRDYRTLPIRVNVDGPEKVGIDRLLNAVAAKAMAPARTPLIVIDAGTAVTVDYINEFGHFVGGAIFPGPRLMARSLNDYTAKLPLVTLGEQNWMDGWGNDTHKAIGAGIAAAVVGGAALAADRIAFGCTTKPWLFVTGGEAKYFDEYEFGSLFAKVEIEEAITLQGIRIAAEALP